MIIDNKERLAKYVISDFETVYVTYAVHPSGSSIGRTASFSYLGDTALLDAEK